MTRLRPLVQSILAGFLVTAILTGFPANAAVRPSAEARGYRLRTYHWDVVLRQRWAVFENAAHPEQPLLAELAETSGPIPETSAAAPNPQQMIKNANAVKVVHVGDQVTLWSEESNVRMEFGATAQENAAIGDRIQLRVTGAGVNGNAGWQATGIVRGPGSVEMER